MHIKNHLEVFDISGGSLQVGIPALDKPDMGRGYTLEIWLRWNGHEAESDETPVARLQAENVVYQLVIDVDHQFTLRVAASDGSAAQSFTFDSVVTADEWTHVALTLALKAVQSANGATPAWTTTLQGGLTRDGQPVPPAQIQTPALTKKPEGRLALDLFSWDESRFRGQFASIFLWRGVASPDQIRAHREILADENHPHKLFALYHDPEGARVSFPQDAVSEITAEVLSLDPENPILSGVEPSESGRKGARRQIGPLGNTLMQQAEKVAAEKRQQAVKQKQARLLEELKEVIRQTNKEQYDFIGFIESGRLRKLQADRITDFFSERTSFPLPGELLGKKIGICQDPLGGYVLFYVKDRVIVCDPTQPGNPIIAEWSEGPGNDILNMEIILTVSDRILDSTILWIVFETHISLRRLNPPDSNIWLVNGDGERLGGG